MALPAKSVQCVVTSPPYWGLRDYGVDGQIGLETSPDAYVAEMVAVFREVRRVLRDDGVLFLNLGDSYAGSWGNQGRTGERGTQRPINGAMLTPVHDGRFPAKQSNTGKIPDGSGLKPKDLVGIPWRVAFSLQADGWYLRSDIIWHKSNPMPESVTDRPTKAHEYVFLLTKSPRYFWDQEAVKEDGCTPRAFLEYTRGDGSDSPINGRASRQARGPTGFGTTGTRNIRTVWTIATHPLTDEHFATFPPELAERCIKAGSRAGDTVLDPFSGAGTTALVADRLGRDAIGIELNPKYHTMAERRLRKDAGMFAEVAVA